VVLCTREPGGTPLAEQLRELVLHAPMDTLTEALLVFAARRDHVQQVIVPAMARGETVLCDRFTDATFAYQGGGRGFDAGLLTQLAAWVHGGLQPQLTLWLDLPAEIAAQRRAAVRQADRFEQQDLAFFARVGDAYLARQRAAAERVVRIDAALERDAVWRQIEQALEARGW
jgi:dTMP kinase